mgnify:CR=1 FL=1
MQKQINYTKSIFGIAFQLAKAEFKLRNEGSYLGIFWYLLNPVLTFILLYLVFFDRLGADIENYAPYLLLGIIMFNFFQGATAEACTSIKNNNNILKSINFPRESLVLGAILRNIFSHFFEIILFFIIAVFFNVSFVGLIYYFLILLLFFVFVFGFSLILGSLCTYFFDLDNIWSFASRALWIATPIFYSIGGQTRLFYANLANPLYYFITAAREIVIYSNIPSPHIVVGVVISSLLFFFTGILVFSALKNKFAELV